MKRILINATQNEEIRVALCKGNHLYDFDLENRTREQKKSNIYKGHVTRVEPSLEAVFVEYGSQRQGFLPIREVSAEYLSGNPRDENIKKLIKEGDELIVQVEKEERGNKGAALSTYVSLAGRYLVLMPNNPRGGGISRQISGKLREDMKRMLGNLDLPKGMSVIIRTAGIGKTQEDLQHDLNHLLNIWQAIQEQNQKYPSPRLVHQEAGVVTRAVRDYLRDDISEIWIDNENAYVEAAGFIDAVMPTQADKLRKYTDYEPMFARFNIEKQIETAYQREVRLPSGGSIVIDQTEALVSIDINSAKSTKGSDVAETAYHTNLEAADEIARQLRLRDMGGLIVIDFIDMNDNKHQKEVEKRLVDATKYDRARVQFGDISRFGLMEMSRQRLRPSLEESTGYICPRCHGNGMIRDLRSLSLSIMREIEQIALKERQGEVQAEVPTDIAAFLLNEKRDSLVYLEQDSGTRITILPHAHLESPNFKLHFNRDGFAPSSYERITDTQQQEHSGLGYDVDWQTAEKERPEQQPTRQPRKATSSTNHANNNTQNSTPNARQHSATVNTPTSSRSNNESTTSTRATQSNAVTSAPVSVNHQNAQPTPIPVVAPSAVTAPQPQAVAWLSNLFAQAPQAQIATSVSSHDAAEAIEALVNTGAQSLGSFGQIDNNALAQAQSPSVAPSQPSETQDNRSSTTQTARAQNSTDDDSTADEKRRRKQRKTRASKPHQRREPREDSTTNTDNTAHDDKGNSNKTSDNQNHQERNHEQNNQSDNTRNRSNRTNSERNSNERQNERSRNDRNDEHDPSSQSDNQNKVTSDEQTRSKRKPHSQRPSRGKLARHDALTTDNSQKQQPSSQPASQANNGKKPQADARHQNPNEVSLQVNVAPPKHKAPEVVRLSLDDSKSEKVGQKTADETQSVPDNSTTLKAVDNTSTINEQNQGIDNTPSTTEAPQEVMASTNRTDNSAEDKKPNVAKEADSSSDNQNRTKIASQDDNQASIKAENQAPASQSSNATSQTTDRHQSNMTHETTQEPTATEPSHLSSDKVENAETASTPLDDVANNTETADISVKSDNSTNAGLELTHDVLFAERYVTANKFGQASNDPRVVRQQQAKSQATSPKVEAASASQPAAVAIRSTVGDFIRATLPDAQDRLANDGVIRSFIESITIHTQQTQTADTDADIDVNARAKEALLKDSFFDFSNYGYQPLAADYLARFTSMTQAVSQFAAAQGKTAVEPRAISARASNDPRGQHPDYQTEMVSEGISDSSPSQTIADEQAEDSRAENNQAESDAAGTQLDAHNIEANALTAQSQADDISIESNQMLQVEQALHEVKGDSQPQIMPDEADDSLTANAVKEDTQKEDSQAAKSKTTIASYKNMIENVAEQLLPQMGVFNLTTPKVPKSRSRKPKTEPKTEPKKPNQAEKIENADSSDSDNDR